MLSALFISPTRDTTKTNGLGCRLLLTSTTPAAPGSRHLAHTGEETMEGAFLFLEKHLVLFVQEITYVKSLLERNCEHF